ncbi:MAG: hypothetical protein MI684_09590 [Chlorobiales bacterium]|nr:hypothetical protein [Chlorobiales bacterium]
MKRKLRLLLATVLFFTLSLLLIFIFNQLYFFASLVGNLHPVAGYIVLGAGTTVFCILVFSLITLWRSPSGPVFPDNEMSPSYDAYIKHLAKTQPVHSKHPAPLQENRDQRWLVTNHKLLETDALHITKEVAVKNFFIGAFAQNTSYGTTTSLMNNLKLVWRVYKLHHRNRHGKDLLALYRFTYESLPLSDFQKDELPFHIKPIIQSSFSNTLATLLPGGNLLTPFFLNFFLAGSTNTYLTCLTGIISTHYCQSLSEEDKAEIVRQSQFEASFMLKEVVKECNPILSKTISNAVKKAGMESLDSVQPSSSGSNLAQDIVSHVAQSLKNIISENVESGKEKP